MRKYDFSDVCEMISEGQFVDSSKVRADALRRYVWIAEWHIPGCLSESQCLCFTKAAAVQAALDMASDENGAPRGMRADLIRHGSSNRVSAGAYVRSAITTVSRNMLRDIL